MKPVVRHPKALMGAVSGTGNGGNDADDFKPGGNQGVAGGNGDQGAPGGDPNSNNYTGGGHGNPALPFPAVVRTAHRQPTHFYRMTLTKMQSRC